MKPSADSNYQILKLTRYQAATCIAGYYIYRSLYTRLIKVFHGILAPLKIMLNAIVNSQMFQKWLRTGRYYYWNSKE